MRKFVQTINLLAFSMLLSAVASATSLIDLYPDGLYETPLSFNEGEGSNYSSGKLGLDIKERTVTLTLNPAWSCPADTICTMQMPTPIVYTLDASFSMDYCGTVYIEGSMDARPVDGAFTSIKARDNSRNICPTFVALVGTEVNFEKRFWTMFESEEFVEELYLFGDELQPVETTEEEEEAPVFSGVIHSAHYQGGELSVNLEYTGGCKKHAFELQWGSCESAEVLNSTIKQCQVELIHSQGSNDACEANIRQTHVVETNSADAAYVIDLDNIEVLLH